MIQALLSIVCTQLHRFIYCHLKLIIHPNINKLFPHKKTISSIGIVCTHLNDFENWYLNLIILFNINNNNNNHHHHIVLAARISLTLSRHSSLSFIALGRSSGQHSVYSHSCWMYVRAGRPAFARPCVGIHKSTSLMSSSLLLQQCPACLVRLTWIVFVIGGRWPYSWCLVGCCCQDLFRIACSIQFHLLIEPSQVLALLDQSRPENNGYEAERHISQTNKNFTINFEYYNLRLIILLN